MERKPEARNVTCEGEKSASFLTTCRDPSWYAFFQGVCDQMETPNSVDPECNLHGPSPSLNPSQSYLSVSDNILPTSPSSSSFTEPPESLSSVATSEISDESNTTGIADESKQTTYKLVGDNIDKNVHPREMRSDHQTHSLHYFHAYAVLDRVDMSGFSTDVQIPDTSEINLRHLLPTGSDESTMRDNFTIIASRILAKYMPFFTKMCKMQTRHIPHEFSSEMAHKSEVVSTS